MWHFQYDSKDPSFQYYILDILFDNLRTMNSLALRISILNIIFQNFNMKTLKIFSNYWNLLVHDHRHSALTLKLLKDIVIDINIIIFSVLILFLENILARCKRSSPAAQSHLSSCLTDSKNLQEKKLIWVFGWWYTSSNGAQTLYVSLMEQ